MMFRYFAGMGLLMLGFYVVITLLEPCPPPGKAPASKLEALIVRVVCR